MKEIRYPCFEGTNNLDMADLCLKMDSEKHDECTHNGNWEGCSSGGKSDLLRSYRWVFKSRVCPMCRGRARISIRRGKQP